MNKLTWTIILIAVVILGIVLWWWLFVTPGKAPAPENVSIPDAGQADDTISQINKELEGIAIEEINLQDIDTDLNQL